MTNEIKNVPELRFPEFKEGWSKLKLGELAEIVRGSSPRPISDPRWFDINSDIGWLRISDVTEQNGKITKLEQKISKDGQKKTRVLHSKHLLLSIAASVGKPVINYVKTGVHDGFLIFLKPLFDIEFMYQWLDAYRPKWKKYGQPGSQVNLNSELVKSQKIYMPHSVEQKKISDFFSKLDQQIELEEKKLAKLEEQKKGYMQKIFSQELRFKDENGNTFEEWKNTNFNYFMSEPDNLEKGIDLRKDQLLTVKLEGNGVSKANINRALKMGSTVYYKRFAGQFIYGKQNFFNGAFGIVPKFLNNYYSSGDVPALNIDYSKIDSKYFINYISRKDYYKKKEAFSTGTGSKRIHEKTLLDFDIMLPSVEEQEKIGDFFSEIDNFIEKQSYKVELLKERKKGFLQKMFV